MSDTTPSTPEPVPPTRQMAVGEFLSKALSLPDLEAWVNRRIAEEQCTERELLLMSFFLLQAIGGSLPWDNKAGLDAMRASFRDKALLPTWRECIGALLGVSYADPNADEAEAEAS